jgi:hypothetical protein
MDVYAMKCREELFREWSKSCDSKTTLKEAFDCAFTLGRTLVTPQTEAGPAPVKREWVLVECVQTYLMRYMVEVPEGKSEWALDTVSMHQAKEFSQQDIGETIASHRVISEAEALKLCDVDNDYCKSWSEELKMKSFFTKESDIVQNVY